jgi:hypothetical protein
VEGEPPKQSMYNQKQYSFAFESTWRRRRQHHLGLIRIGGSDGRGQGMRDTLTNRGNYLLATPQRSRSSLAIGSVPLEDRLRNRWGYKPPNLHGHLGWIRVSPRSTLQSNALWGRRQATERASYLRSGRASLEEPSQRQDL